MKVVSLVLILVVNLQTVQFCVGRTTRCNQYSGLGFRNGNCELCTRTSRCAYYQDGEIGYCIPLAQVVNMGRISAHSFTYPKDYSRVYRKAVEFIRSSSLPIYWHKGLCNQAGIRQQDLGFERRAYQPDYTNGANPVSSEEVEDECKDDFFNCRYWALVGECSRNAANMHKICQKSCGICKSEPCEDMDPYCADWASTGECESNPIWMQTNCKLACKVCKPAICMDRNENCAEWASLGECSGSNLEYMVTSCALSCSACQPEVIPTTTMLPPKKQCFTCGTSYETSGEMCDDKLTVTTIDCKDPATDCLYEFPNSETIAMGCNDGKYTSPMPPNKCVHDDNNGMNTFCVCDYPKTCNLEDFCKLIIMLNEHKFYQACIYHPQLPPELFEKYRSSTTTITSLEGRCYTCGTTYETSDDICDDNLTGTFIECKDSDDTCLYVNTYLPGLWGIQMGCNDGELSMPVTSDGCKKITYPNHTEVEWEYCACKPLKNCNLKLACNLNVWLEEPAACKNLQ